MRYTRLMSASIGVSLVAVQRKKCIAAAAKLSQELTGLTGYIRVVCKEL